MLGHKTDLQTYLKYALQVICKPVEVNPTSTQSFKSNAIASVTFGLDIMINYFISQIIDWVILEV